MARAKLKPPEPVAADCMVCGEHGTMTSGRMETHTSAASKPGEWCPGTVGLPCDGEWDNNGHGVSTREKTRRIRAPLCPVLVDAEGFRGCRNPGNCAAHGTTKRRRRSPQVSGESLLDRSSRAAREAE